MQKNTFPIGFLLVILSMIGLLLYISHKSPANKARSKNPPAMEVSPLKGDARLALGSPETQPKLSQDQRLEAWLDKLIVYENCPSQGIIDSNSLRSYGPYCYQKATYLFFMEDFGHICMPYAERSEWVNNLSDRTTQRCLTRLKILSDPNAYKHWLTSTVIRNGLGKPPIMVNLD